MWWRGLRGICELAEVAIKILGAPVTSAATERSFSTFAWIHSKKRNRLTSDRAAKITYLAHNWKLMHETPKSHNSKKIKQNHDEEIGAENLIPVEEEIECESEPDYTESESDESESEPGKSESELLYSSEEDESE